MPTDSVVNDNLIPLFGSLAIKVSTQGTLIYLGMLAYAVSMLFFLLRKKRVAETCYFIAFFISVISFVYRWGHVEHIPMQNMFEVFLTLGMAGWPISLFCRKLLKVGGEPGDVLLSFILLFPAGLVFSAEPQQLPPALQSPLFGPHVAAYMLAYFVLAKAALQAVSFLIGLKHKGNEADLLVDFNTGTYRIVCLGFPLLTLGLMLGCVWGKLAWGDYWNWDPKEMWSFASWLVYVIYFHWRYAFGKKYPRIACSWAVLGLIFIIITLLWVNLSSIFDGLHSYATAE